MGRYSKWDDRCSGCKKLFSLGSECLIITLIIVHVLSSALELLIHFEVIQVPGADQVSSQTATQAVLVTSPSTTIPTTDKSSAHDPGGSKCDPQPHHDKLILAVDILRYICVVISVLFVLEISCKIIYLRKDFFRDLWQVFDLIVVIVNLAVELAFLVRHDSLLCVHIATEVATFIVVLRLWRIPRACNIKKEEYSARLDTHIEHLTKTKIETDHRCQHMEVLYQQQEQEIKQLKTVLRDANLLQEEWRPNTDGVPNGKAQSHNLKEGFVNKLFHTSKTDGLDATDASVVITRNGHVHSKATPLLTVEEESTQKQKKTGNAHNVLERNDSDVNSKANDSGIEAKDSFRSDITGNSAAAGKVATEHCDGMFDDSDTEVNDTKEVFVQEVEVQIEPTARQAQLPSITSNNRSFDGGEEHVVLRVKKKAKGDSSYVNEAYDADDDTKGGGTYKSADGIPTTEL